MSNKSGSQRQGHGWTVFVWAGAALLLLAPLVAMQVTSDVAWSTGDFVTFGLMLVAACSAMELAVRLAKNRTHLLMALAAVAAAFLLVWAELAVGIFR